MSLNRRSEICGRTAEKARARLWLPLLVTIVGLALVAPLGGCRARQEADEVVVDDSYVAPVEPDAGPGEAPPEGAATEEPGEEAGQAEATVVKIETEKGAILVELFDLDAPITAGNFLLLVDYGFYNGLTFHRVDPGFVIQGGDPEGDGSGGPGFTIPLQVTPRHTHDRGILSMARSGQPDSAGSQFFICLGGPDKVERLDGGYAVFGEVVEGMDVVDQIEPGDKMVKVTVESESPDAAAARSAARKARVPK